MLHTVLLLPPLPLSIVLWCFVGQTLPLDRCLIAAITVERLVVGLLEALNRLIEQFQVLLLHLMLLVDPRFEALESEIRRVQEGLLLLVLDGRATLEQVTQIH